MNIGSTEPKFAILEDGTQVVVKLFNGEQGNLVLFNEQLCYGLATLLDIPMPVSGVCVFDANTEIQVEKIAGSNNYGKAFYSEFMPKVTKLVPSIIDKINNKEDFIKIILFDHVVFNTDRNPGNLLVKFYKDDISLKVIDHTHVFVNQSIWDGNCLRDAMKQKDLFSTNVLEKNMYLYRMFLQSMMVSKELLEKESMIFKNKINYDTIIKLIETIPDEWKPPKKDIEQLVEYILYRINNLDVIISTITTYYNI